MRETSGRRNALSDCLFVFFFVTELVNYYEANIGREETQKIKELRDYTHQLGEQFKAVIEGIVQIFLCFLIFFTFDEIITVCFLLSIFFKKKRS